MLPLEYMLYILNTSKDETAQRWAAEKAAAYCHAKFVSHEIQGATPAAVAINNPGKVELVVINDPPIPHPARLLTATPTGNS